MAEIYQNDMVEIIFAASSAGITEYAQDLDRNLTNDEWVVRQLIGFGIKQSNLEFINLHDGFFGTFSEAKTLNEISIKKGIRKLILVCSAYHSKRVWITFSKVLQDSGIEIEVLSAADEKVTLRELLFEYAKLIFYRNILVPFEVWAPKIFFRDETMKQCLTLKENQLLLKDAKAVFR